MDAEATTLLLGPAAPCLPVVLKPEGAPESPSWLINCTELGTTPGFLNPGVWAGVRGSTLLTSSWVLLLFGGPRFETHALCQ